MEETFLEWCNRVRDEIVTVQELLRIPLSDNPVAMTEQLREVDAHQGRLTSLLADAGALLVESQGEVIYEMDTDMKALDKEVVLKAKTSQEKRMETLLHGLCKAVQSRIMLGMSLLKSEGARPC